MERRGHVFVVRGDVNSIACDWQLVPAGTDAIGAGHIKPHWFASREFQAQWDQHTRRFAPDRERRAVALPKEAGRRGFIVVHTGETGHESPAWFADAIHAAARLLTDSSEHPLHGRERPLVALPMLGTGGGGAGQRRAGVMQALLGTAEAVADDIEVDFVLVVRDAQSYSAAQRIRSERTPAPWDRHLDNDMIADAERLARSARAGSLVAFIGSGLSATSGLPDWRQLLEDLGRLAELDDDELKDLNGLDARDAGAVLETRLGGSRGLDDALRKCFAGDWHPSLSHYLVASLPITEAATTNYDTLFETAWQAATGAAPAVLPRQQATASSERWLLKLHGDLADAQRRRPLVLSREQYLRFEQSSAAIAAVVQAMLLTRHLLITGFGLNDETFHRIAHDVRQIRRTNETSSMAEGADQEGRSGTAVLVRPAGLVHQVWQEDLDLLQLAADGASLQAASRRQEILLDLLGHLAASPEAYLLGDGWQELSQPGADAELRRALETVEQVVARGDLTQPLARAARDTLRRFGLPGDLTVTGTAR